jgi:hypothetical protein
MAIEEYGNRPRRDYGDRPRRKEYTPAGYIKKEMNPEVYEKRRKVIDVIYEAKRLAASIGVDLPRIQARVVDKDPNEVIRKHSLGTATMGAKEIWIPEDCLSGMYQGYLRQVVFHEILHAAFSIPHDERSKLMGSAVGSTPLSKEVADALFVKHIQLKLGR